jgi:hypothetical protein
MHRSSATLKKLLPVDKQCQTNWDGQKQSNRNNQNLKESFVFKSTMPLLLETPQNQKDLINNLDNAIVFINLRVQQTMTFSRRRRLSLIT